MSSGLRNVRGNGSDPLAGSDLASTCAPLASVRRGSRTGSSRRTYASPTTLIATPGPTSDARARLRCSPVPTDRAPGSTDGVARTPLAGLRVLHFGHFDPQYSRNRIVAKALTRAGADVRTVTDPRPYARRTPALVRGALATPVDLVVVGFPGHADVVTAKAIARRWRAPVLFDAFVSLQESAEDRGRPPGPGHARASPHPAGGPVVVPGRRRRAGRHRRARRPLRHRPRRAPAQAASPVGRRRRRHHAAARPHRARRLPRVRLRQLHPAPRARARRAAPPPNSSSAASRCGSTSWAAATPNPRSARSRRNSACRACGSRAVGPTTSSPSGWRPATSASASSARRKKAQRVIPNKVYDALACARPVLTADTPAVRELLRPGVEVGVCPPGDPVALADAIAGLRRDGELREGLATRGHARFVEAASLNALAARPRSDRRRDALSAPHITIPGMRSGSGVARATASEAG